MGAAPRQAMDGGSRFALATLYKLARLARWRRMRSRSIGEIDEACQTSCFRGLRDERPRTQGFIVWMRR
jgi:hypothetical protein